MAAQQLAESPFVLAWQGFAFDEGAVEYGTKFRRDDPIVARFPQFFVDELLPVRDWPNPIDPVIEANKQRALAEENDRRERFEAAARQNPAHLSVTLFKSKRDFATTIAGEPTLVKKGSIVADGHPLLLGEHADQWEKTR